MAVQDVFNIVFNLADPFMKHLITQRLKHTEFGVLQDWAPDDKGQRVRKYKYVMELRKGMGFGPKSTRVFITQRITKEDPGRFYLIEHVSETPDVPSGDAFRVVNHFGLFALDNARSRLLVTGEVEFTGSTMFKAIIDTSATAGFVQFANDLRNELDAVVKKRQADGKILEAGGSTPSPIDSAASTASPSPIEVKEEEEEAAGSDELGSHSWRDVLRNYTAAFMYVVREHKPLIAFALLLFVVVIMQLVVILRTNTVLSQMSQSRPSAFSLQQVPGDVELDLQGTKAAAEHLARQLGQLISKLNSPHGEANDEL